MGRRFVGATSVGIARNIALVLGCLIIASCTGGANYSERVVADGEPVP